MQTRSGTFPAVVVLIVGGNGKIVEVTTTDQGPEGPEGSGLLWAEAKSVATARTSTNKVTAVYRYDNMTVGSLVQLLFKDTPKQRLEKANETFGQAPMDSIGLIESVRIGGPNAERFLGNDSLSAEDIADALLAGREVEDTHLWQDIFSVVGEMLVISQRKEDAFKATATLVYSLYYEKLGISPAPGSQSHRSGRWT
jgi:hypothetical protein